jgi:Arc/MetJ-type ribon-helix-helix transcriptional regulator
VETTVVRAQVPAGLLSQAESLVEDGWFGDVNEVIVDALRRFLEARFPELMQSQIWQDVEWGLHGED